MDLEHLTSSHNPLLKTIRLAASGSRRAPRNLVVAEGIRVLEEVQKRRCKVEAAIITEDFGYSPREELLLRSWMSQDARVCRADARTFRSITDVETPQGALALVRVPEFSLEAHSLPRDALLLFACGIQDPGNLGTLIRTAAAAGVSLVGTSKGTVMASNPKCIRASAGAYFHIPVMEHLELSTFETYCSDHGIQILRTDVRAGLPYTQIDFRARTAILLGNEGRGITGDAPMHIQTVHIPMAEGIESLNVATAGAVLLFEAARQRA
jgi:TrmH family RNA methyltransferase